MSDPAPSSPAAPSGGVSSSSPPPTPPPGPSEVTEEEAASLRTGVRRAKLDLKPTHKLGKELVQWFLIGIALTIGLILVWAVSTYPGIDDVRELTALSPGAENIDAADTLRELRSEWLDSVTRISQTFVFGSLLPVVTTVIGYIFGRQDE